MLAYIFLFDSPWLTHVNIFLFDSHMTNLYALQEIIIFFVLRRSQPLTTVPRYHGTTVMILSKDTIILTKNYYAFNTLKNH